jgi:hypothetical protein
MTSHTAFKKKQTADGILQLSWLPYYGVQFLGAFAEFRKVNISVVMSVRLSLCPHGTTRLPLDGLDEI